MLRKEGETLNSKCNGPVNCKHNITRIKLVVEPSPEKLLSEECKWEKFFEKNMTFFFFNSFFTLKKIKVDFGD